MTSPRRSRRWRTEAPDKEPGGNRRGYGRVFVLSSPSGGGKTTVVEQLRRRMPDVVRSVSVTTRRPRLGERSGREYQFVSPAEFQRLVRAGGVLEWARVHDAYYATPRGPVLRALARGQNVILSIDVQGARQVRRGLGKRAVLVFLLPPSFDDLRKRLMRRSTDTPSAIRRRLAAAKRELACAAWYDHTVVNNELNRAVAEVQTIIREADPRVRRTASGRVASGARDSRRANQRKGQ